MLIVSYRPDEMHYYMALFQGQSSHCQWKLFLLEKNFVKDFFVDCPIPSLSNKIDNSSLIEKACILYRNKHLNIQSHENKREDIIGTTIRHSQSNHA